MAIDLEKYIAYAGSNKQTSAGALFYNKKMYHNEMRRQKEPSYLDLWYTKPLYGKVNTGLDFVVPRPESMKELNVRLITLSNGQVISTDDDEKLGSVYALNFVADAFNAMNLYLKDLRNKGKIYENSFFTPLQAHKGWTDINKLYQESFQRMYRIFIDNYVFANRGQINRRIKTFDDYFHIFIHFLNERLNRGDSITKSGLISKSRCPHSVSGLVIEIAKESDFSNDSKKYNRYFSDLQMSTYLETVTNFGFYVDMNVPWRLVANLESPAWQENRILREIVDSYFENGYNLQSVFEEQYTKAHRMGVHNLKIIVKQFYNSLVEQVPSYSVPEVCRSIDSVRSNYAPARESYARRVTRRPITSAEMEKKYDDSFWLRLYMHVRFKEMNIQMSEHQLRYEFKEMLRVYRTIGYGEAVNHISQRMSFYLESQIKKFLHLQKKGEIPLTSGLAPDIVL